MLLGEFNLSIILFIILLASILINTNTFLHLLLTAELLWITLFAITLIIGIIYDNLNLLALTFFFLVFSAVEFGIGLVLMLCQNTITKSVSLDSTDTNFSKFSNRIKLNLFINKHLFKI